MDSEIQLISDGDGVALIGDPTAIDHFLAIEKLPSKDLGLPRLSNILRAGSGTVRLGSTLASSSGRWVQLTEHSAKALKAGNLMTGSTPGVGRAVLTEHGGRISEILEIAKGPGSLLTNPAVLAGAAGIMAQLAMKQSMDEIADYLATIDEKLDDVLRAQKDAVIADMIGVGFAIEEAMTLREGVGRVSEVTWSKVQATPTTIARTQAYVLRQLDAIAEKLERKASIGDLASASKEAELKVQEWLAILARCFQLQEGIAILELDRVLDASPDDLDRHRLALRSARHSRLELISRSTQRLMARMDDAAGTANRKVLLHPISAKAVVYSSNHVATVVVNFQGRLGIERDRDSLEARRWVDAASDARDKAIHAGADGVDTAKRFSSETFDNAKSVTEKLTSEIAERVRRRRGRDEERHDKSDKEV